MNQNRMVHNNIVPFLLLIFISRCSRVSTGTLRAAILVPFATFAFLSVCKHGVNTIHLSVILFVIFKSKLYCFTTLVQQSIVSSSIYSNLTQNLITFLV